LLKGLDGVFDPLSVLAKGELLEPEFWFWFSVAVTKPFKLPTKGIEL